MKKITQLFLGFCSLAFAGCGNNATTATDPTTGTKTADSSKAIAIENATLAGNESIQTAS